MYKVKILMTDAKKITLERVIKTGGTPYTGEYEVTPAFESQTLETENKLMTDDVTVYAIPWEEVSNPQGGLTVTIGGY